MKIITQIAKWLIALLALVALVFFVLWKLNAPAELTEGSATANRLNGGDYGVEQIGIKFVDTARSTPAMGKFEGADSRTLKGSIWFPKLDTGTSLDDRHPLIVFSHGFGSYHEGCRHIAEYLARNGYIVAAVDFPLSHTRSPAGTPQLFDVSNQAGDVSAVIDHVLGLNENSESALYQRVQAQAIGAMGLSLGGLTTALVSFHPELLDERISASVMYAPPLEAFSERFFNIRPELPSLIMSGSYDRIVPEPANATMLHERNPNGWFISLDKGSHLGFANIGDWLRWTNNPDDLGCAVTERNLDQLELPEQWSDIITNPNGELIDVEVGQPCPQIDDRAMNGTRQHWLTRVATGAFFDMHLRGGEVAARARTDFEKNLVTENADVQLTAPR